MGYCEVKEWSDCPKQASWSGNSKREEFIFLSICRLEMKCIFSSDFGNNFGYILIEFVKCKDGTVWERNKK